MLSYVFPKQAWFFSNFDDLNDTHPFLQTVTHLDQSATASAWLKTSEKTYKTWWNQHDEAQRAPVFLAILPVPSPKISCKFSFKSKFPIAACQTSVPPPEKSLVGWLSLPIFWFQKTTSTSRKVCCCPEIWNTSNTTQVSHRLIWNEMPPFYLTSARLGLHETRHFQRTVQVLIWHTHQSLCLMMYSTQSKSCKFKWFVARNKARQVWQTIA